MIDPELALAVELFPPLSFGSTPLAEVRRQLDEMTSSAAQHSGQIVKVDCVRDPQGPPVPVHVFGPANRQGRLPAVLHIHGGGYVLGSPTMVAAANEKLASALGCAIFSVDYRLAPETRHPGALEDCYAVLKWLHAEADSLGIDRDRIGVMGESAGAGLAAALALLARDRGEAAIAFQHLIQPMLDDRTCTLADDHPYAGEFVWTREHNRFGWTSLLGTAPGRGDVPPYAAAARAVDLSGLPPAFISVGTLDLFFEENLEYARRLTRAGVPVELHVYPGAYHGFELIAGASVSSRALRDSEEALRRSMSV
ncbi:alpha/beta hydrolase [Sphingomonas sp. Root710]|uniref:alpha/beta hydrolase n=1 Tax=Sphingomonas sp. Root710 TaxID=1736594 RepID=UPI001F2473FF|nr:alpha/beta hydrolase [Sphingomonas sp. Root710]